MSAIAFYRQQADRCRAMADEIPPMHSRDQLLRMAAEWDALAASKEAVLRRHTSGHSSQEEMDRGMALDPGAGRGAASGLDLP
jgi:hypothetical protein